MYIHMYMRMYIYVYMYIYIKMFAVMEAPVLCLLKHHNKLIAGCVVHVYIYICVNK